MHIKVTLDVSYVPGYMDCCYIQISDIKCSEIVLSDFISKHPSYSWIPGN